MAQWNCLQPNYFWLVKNFDCDILLCDIYIVHCCCSRGDGRHAGGDLREGEDGDNGGERAHGVGAAPRAAVSRPARAIPRLN